jgi:hypothetical protein
MPKPIEGGLALAAPEFLQGVSNIIVISLGFETLLQDSERLQPMLGFLPQENESLGDVDDRLASRSARLRMA